MKLAAFSVRNYQFTLVVFIAALAVGMFALLNMPRAEDPVFEAPTYIIIAVYPGAGPQDVEELVVDPIEEKMAGLDDIRNIISDVDDGLAVIRVEYKHGSDTDEKYQEVIRELNSIRSELPADLNSLDIRRITASDVSILQLALVSETAPYRELARQAEALKEQLETVKSLKTVQTWGYPDEEVRIVLDLDKLAQLRIPSNQVLGAIQASNVNIPGGSLEEGARRFNVKTSGGYSQLEEIRNTVIAGAGGSVVYLRDVARADFAYADESHLTRYNGRRCVLVTASLKDGEHIFRTMDAVNPVLDAFAPKLPPSIVLERAFDQSESVGSRLNRFAKDFGIAIGLVLLTLLPLGFRASAVVMISIPLSLSIGLAQLYFLGYTINQLSIVGMIIALGLLVDDSIVVVENIERYLRMGYQRAAAAIAATKQIGLAVIGTTATLIFAFLPLLFLPDNSGDFIRSLPMAVVTTVLASLFVSLTIVPFLSSQMLSEKEHGEGNLFLRLLKKGISLTYSRLLHAALQRPYLALLVAALLFGGSVALVPVIGFSLFPKSEKPQFLINITTPIGTTLAATDSVTRYVEQELLRHAHIRNISANVGKGNPRIYYNVPQQSESPNFAELFVQLDGADPAEKTRYIDELREAFRTYPNARIEVKDFEQGPPIEAPIAIRILGDDLDTLRRLSAEVEALMKRTEGAIYVNNPLSTLKTDLRVRINREKAGLLGVQISEIDRGIRMGVAGLTVGRFSDAQGEEYLIEVTATPDQTADASVFDKLYINSVTGAAVPLSQVADIRFETSPPMIRHYDKQRFSIVTAFVESGYLTETVSQQIFSELDRFPFPEGYSYLAAGEAESKQRSFGGLEVIILITIFGIMAILILEFRTFKSTLIVLSVVPLGFVGSIVMLLITGNPLSFTAVVGLIALVGIEVKNSILLVDFTNQLRAKGMGLTEAIEEAGEIRFVPIVLTSLTAIGGLIPLALENNPLYSILAIVLIGGLISSTLLSRIVTPVVYKLLPPRVEPEPEAGM
ncbi:MAG: efflux RND transporter permease subunit [Bacteroidia bacterium]|nr:efflux RND transporter permease subunit [Bacteroidia bacterium]